LVNNLRRCVVAAVALAAAALPVRAAADSVPAPPQCISLVPGLPLSCPPPPQPSQTSHAAAAETSSSSSPRSVSAAPELARSLLAEVNRVRRAHGLRVLVYSAPLARAGTEHAGALALAGMFTHNWPSTGHFFASWIRTYYPARGFRAWSAGENLLWASPGFAPANAVQQWLDSPTHRRVMLTRSWRELGIGVVSAAGAPGAYGGRDVQIAAAEFGLRRR
jgi:uncharacterized protein YkwD